MNIARTTASGHGTMQTALGCAVLASAILAACGGHGSRDPEPCPPCPAPPHAVVLTVSDATGAGLSSVSATANGESITCTPPAGSDREWTCFAHGGAGSYAVRVDAPQRAPAELSVAVPARQVSGCCTHPFEPARATVVLAPAT